MLLERLTVRNWCNLPERDITFSPGMTAIIGANGVGKSSVFGAIRWLLTGENPTVGTKLENIYQLADVADKAWGRLQFSHGGVRAVVTRYLRPEREKSVLEIAGQPTLLGDANINPKILEILGINAKTINEIVLVAQDDIFSFLAKTDSERSAVFQRLFQTEIAAAAHKDLGVHMGKIKIPATAVSMDEARATLARLQDAASALSKTREPFPAYEVLEQQRTDAAAIMTTFAEQQRIIAARDNVTGELAAAAWAVVQAQERCNAVANDVATLQQAKDGNVAAADAAKLLLANLDHFRGVESQRIAIRGNQARVQASLDALQAPTRPEDYIADAEFQPLEHDLGHRLKLADDLLTVFAGGRHECPTCGTPVATLQPVIDKAIEERPRLVRGRSALRDRRARSTVFEKAEAAYTQQQSRLMQSIQGFASQLEALETLTPPQVDEATLRETVAQQQNYEHGLAEYTTALQGHERELARLTGRSEQLMSQASTYNATIAAMTMITPADAAQAQQRHVDLLVQLGQLRDLETALAVADRDVANQLQRIDELRRVETEAQQARTWLQYVEGMRGLVHYSAAPRFVTQRNLQRMTPPINEHLQLFDTDFRVTPTEGLSFLASFVDGRQQMAERLSNGQKVILAVSWRFALNLNLAADIGLLGLDEPTAWLDKHHIRGFTPALTRMRQYAAARGLQVIIITHEDELAPLFDAVIQL